MFNEISAVGVVVTLNTDVNNYWTW